MMNASFKYLVNSSLADRAKFVKDANTAKKVALYLIGAFFAIHPSKWDHGYLP